MKPESQSAVALALRSALWNWFDVFPKEYCDAALNPRRLEGASERVFDVLMQMTDESRKRPFWPTLTVLMCTSPERLKQAEAALSGAATTKSTKKVCLTRDSHLFNP
jgi:neurofibromin 1